MVYIFKYVSVITLNIMKQSERLIEVKRKTENYKMISSLFRFKLSD